MATMKTPGVYIIEKNAFPNSVVEAPTSIPAFIGITEKAQNGADSLDNTPWKITSMTEYHKYFGSAPKPMFTLSVGDDIKDSLCAFPDKDGKQFLMAKSPTAPLYTLYYNMVMFFANGGGTCYIVSVGTYGNNGALDKTNVQNALNALTKEQEVTMVVVPEAVTVDADTCTGIQQSVIAHCGQMQNRIGIFDVYPKEKVKETEEDKEPMVEKKVKETKEDKEPTVETMEQQINKFRDAIGSNYLSYGAAYYPWLNTSVLSDKDINSNILIWDNTLYKDGAPEISSFFNKDAPLPTYFKAAFEQVLNEEKKIGAETNASPEEEEAIREKVAALKADLHNALIQNWPEYKQLAGKVKDSLNVLPPSAAMAGIYTMVDNTRGVWKAPANVSINYVNSLTETIDNKAQEELNVPMNGKAINAIRSFVGDGIKVWGARTLDGNSLDWRYVNVRRTMIYLEESIKNAAKAYVFEPNTAGTWVSIKAMIDNFLVSVWKRGGLAGAVPEDAFEVHIGLGDTMTPEDILEGIMRITVLVAVTRPAEFIEITFQQQMQKS
ncbi:MAG: phage tail sheath subtilisin-like domain-containing protein [Mediterranea sp.]|jgi:phage tail sheath protein FI|nr:phage tail sheath subtilisin-like domain-containing protein [Mediterranea sp.]